MYMSPWLFSLFCTDHSPAPQHHFTLASGHHCQYGLAWCLMPTLCSISLTTFRPCWSHWIVALTPAAQYLVYNTVLILILRLYFSTPNHNSPPTPTIWNPVWHKAVSGDCAKSDAGTNRYFSYVFLPFRVFFIITFALSCNSPRRSLGCPS